MQKGGQWIAWKFVEDLYLMGTKSQGLTTQHRLKYEHVHETSFSNMRVDLATQVSHHIQYLLELEKIGVSIIYIVSM